MVGAEEKVVVDGLGRQYQGPRLVAVWQWLP